MADPTLVQVAAHSHPSASPVAPKYTVPPRANALPKGLAKAKAGPVGGPNSLMVGAPNPVTLILTQVVSTAWEVTFGWLPAADQGLTVEQRPKLPLDFFSSMVAIGIPVTTPTDGIRSMEALSAFGMGYVEAPPAPGLHCA